MQNKEYKKQYYQEHKQKLLERQRRYYKNHPEKKTSVCVDCGNLCSRRAERCAFCAYKSRTLSEKTKRNHKNLYYQEHKNDISKKNARYYQENNEQAKKRVKQYRDSHKEEIKIKGKIFNGKLKYEVLSYYSSGIPKCLVCRVEDIDVLCIDHINNDGRKQRREINFGYSWLKKQGFPEGYQVLCFNHNMKKEIEKPKIIKYLAEKRHRDLRKSEVLAYYSINNIPTCSICSINDISMLCIDHINGDGYKHRKEHKASGKSLYLWLKNNDFPDGFQTLCANHNQKKKIVEHEYGWKSNERQEDRFIRKKEESALGSRGSTKNK
jgi:hypothetical protein